MLTIWAARLALAAGRQWSANLTTSGSALRWLGTLAGGQAVIQHVCLSHQPLLPPRCHGMVTATLQQHLASRLAGSLLLQRYASTETGRRPTRARWAPEALAEKCKRLQKEWKSSRDPKHRRQLYLLLEEQLVQLASNRRTGAGQQLRDMSPIDLNKVAGAAAAVLEKQAPAQFVRLLADAVVAALPCCAARETANLVWALAKLDPDLHPNRVAAAGDGSLEAIGARVTRLHGDMNAIDLANTLVAFGKWRQAPDSVDVARLAERLGALSSALETQRFVTPQILANALWGLARLHEPGEWRADDHAEVVAAVASALVERAAAASPQDLSNTLWGLATMWGEEGEASGQALGGEREGLLQRLARSFANVLHKAQPQELANVVWAAGRLRGVAWPPELLQGVERVLEQLQPPATAQWKPLDVSQLLWGCYRLRWRLSDAAAAPLLQQFEAQLSQYSSQNIANTLLAVASMRLPLRAPVVQAALRRLATLAADGQCNVQAACTALWAAAVLQVYDARTAGLLVAWLEPRAGNLLVEAKVQLVQVHLVYKLCTAVAERVELLPAPLLAACTQATAACNTTHSKQAVNSFQRDLLSVVRTLRDRDPFDALLFDSVCGEQLLEGGLFVADASLEQCKHAACGV